MSDDRIDGGDNEVVCRVRLGKYVVHGCEAKSVKISSKKWRWIERKKEFGYVNVKTTKVICRARTKGVVFPEKVRTNWCTAVQQGKSGGEGDNGSTVGTDNPNFESESFTT